MEKNNHKEANFTIYGNTAGTQKIIEKTLEDSHNLITIKANMGTTPGQIMVVGAVNKKVDILLRLAVGDEYYDDWTRRLTDTVNSVASPLAELASELIYKCLEKIAGESGSEDAEE